MAGSLVLDNGAPHTLRTRDLWLSWTVLANLATYRRQEDTQHSHVPPRLPAPSLSLSPLSLLPLFDLLPPYSSTVPQLHPTNDCCFSIRPSLALPLTLSLCLRGIQSCYLGPPPSEACWSSATAPRAYSQDKPAQEEIEALKHNQPANLPLPH